MSQKNKYTENKTTLKTKKMIEKKRKKGSSLKPKSKRFKINRKAEKLINDFKKGKFDNNENQLFFKIQRIINKAYDLEDKTLIKKAHILFNFIEMLKYDNPKTTELALKILSLENNYWENILKNKYIKCAECKSIIIKGKNYMYHNTCINCIE